MEDKTFDPLPSNNMQLTDDPEIAGWKRDAPPAHFLLKIQAFSQLSLIVENTDVHKYESGVFEVSDYKWKLLVYPNGNARRNGEGYISLYLALADTKPISNGSRVEVTVKFFVYDSNGYLLDDCCAFGVEVHLIKPTGKVEELSLTKEPNNASYTWKIKRFSSTLHQNSYDSEVFNAAGYKWKLQLYPSENSREKDRSLSLYLWLVDNVSGQGVYAEYNKVLIKDQVNGIHQERKGSQWFGSRSWVL